jgi:hypothetical protein
VSLPGPLAGRIIHAHCQEADDGATTLAPQAVISSIESDADFVPLPI